MVVNIFIQNIESHVEALVLIVIDAGISVTKT